MGGLGCVGFFSFPVDQGNQEIVGDSCRVFGDDAVGLGTLGPDLIWLPSLNQLDSLALCLIVSFCLSFFTPGLGLLRPTWLHVQTIGQHWDCPWVPIFFGGG